MVNLFYDSFLVLSKVYRDGAYVKQAFLEVPIEELNRPKTTKLCYGVLDKDIELSYYVDALCEKSPKPVVKILLKIAMYAYKYLGKSDYAVTNSIVELAKKMGKNGVSGFINSVMRKFYKTDFELPKDKLLRLSVKYSYPLFAVKKLVEDYGEDTAKKIMEYDEENSFIRFNVGVDGENYLVENGYSYEKTAFDNLFKVKSAKVNEDFYRGIFTFQSIGSVAICFAIKKGESILDACAAPGGKSVLLAEKFERVTSFELHPHRVELINNYAQRMGRTNVNATICDSSVFNAEYENKFESILCDVPCSGYGTLKVNPDIKLKDGAYVKGLTLVQYSILENCAKYLKSGGTIYYSTCSIFKDENDNIINKFLDNHEDFALTKLSTPLESVETVYGLQFLPHISQGAGFYIAALTKK